MIICRDSQFVDVPLEQVPMSELTCNEPAFELEQDRYGPLINWNGSNADEPPFSSYTLYYSKVMNIGNFQKREPLDKLRLIDTGKKMASEIKLNGQPIRTRLTNLEPDSVYRVCLYNSYLFNKEFIPGKINCTKVNSNRIFQVNTVNHISPLQKTQHSWTIYKKSVQ